VVQVLATRRLAASLVNYFEQQNLGHVLSQGQVVFFSLCYLGARYDKIAMENSRNIGIESGALRFSTCYKFKPNFVKVKKSYKNKLKKN